ncbi:protein of unknown function [Georgfuchsia toluolica]|uniref:Uncharacterized protein n=1 Tax=Georgfuchsia toluolica TaxID=424218 RepID=A0A916J4K1_9PROT|nr:protein of unknown function [Georgfuchsia toluolica]
MRFHQEAWSAPRPFLTANQTIHTLRYSRRSPQLNQQYINITGSNSDDSPSISVQY